MRVWVAVGVRLGLIVFMGVSEAVCEGPGVMVTLGVMVALGICVGVIVKVAVGVVVGVGVGGYKRTATASP